MPHVFRDRKVALIRSILRIFVVLFVQVCHMVVTVKWHPKSPAIIFYHLVDTVSQRCRCS